MPGETAPGNEPTAEELAQMEMNRGMMQAAAETPGVPGQRNVVESSDTSAASEEAAKAENPDIITSADVPNPQ